MKSPSAEEKTEQNPSPKPEAYQPGDKIGNINLESDEQIFNKLSKIADSVNPVADEDFWRRRRELQHLLKTGHGCSEVKPMAEDR